MPGFGQFHNKNEYMHEFYGLHKYLFVRAFMINGRML